jgi:hypothetical protein
MQEELDELRKQIEELKARMKMLESHNRVFKAIERLLYPDVIDDLNRLHERLYGSDEVDRLRRLQVFISKAFKDNHSIHCDLLHGGENPCCNCDALPKINKIKSVK